MQPDPIAAALEWLEQQIADAERVALAATGDRWRWIDPGHPRIKQVLVDADGAWVLPAALADAYPSVHDAGHIAHHDPARALREVAALRKVVAEHQPDGSYVYRDDGTPACGTCGDYTVAWPCPTIRAVAGIWGDNPDFPTDRRPDAA